MLLLILKNPAAIVIGATINIENGLVNPPVKNSNPDNWSKSYITLKVAWLLDNRSVFFDLIWRKILIEEENKTNK